MPASPDAPDRRSSKLPPALLWAGVGVAPLAALALVLGSGERSLRIAIGLALLAVVLIGLSIVLRPTIEAVKVDLEDSLYDEMDVVREDMRNDIATAARATHRSFGERFEHLQAAFEQLRGQVEALRAELARQPQSAMPHGTIGAGLSGPPRPTGTVPAGVVRHTETVQVTTRSTIVDPHADEPPPVRGPAWSGQAPRRSGDNVYGSRPEPAPGPAYEPAPSYEESWTEQQLRKRLAEAEASRAGSSPSSPSSPSEETERWSGVRSGDRWASVRSDERGRELRIGERRTSMHSDDSGAEVRYEDRWATVRRDAAEERRWPPEPDRAPTRREPEDDRRGAAYGTPYRDGRDGRDSGGRGRRDWDDRDWNGRENGPRALPSTSDEPSASEWVNRWSADSAPEPQRRHRYADDY